jgi:hypothetical protein
MPPLRPGLKRDRQALHAMIRTSRFQVLRCEFYYQ